jgi:hypothetical protein
MMKKLLVIISTAILLTACGGDTKIVVMSKGPADINTDAKTIKAKDGSGHEEKEVVLNGDKIVFSLSTPAGEATVQLFKNGLYIINVKNDTIIGSYQQYGDPKLAPNMIMQSKMKHDLDSLRLLVDDKNVSDANRNFYILPNHAARISDNINAQVIGPYHRMTSAEKIDGKIPEIYRFYSIKEIRETIAKLEGLTAPILK